ncbi:MAG: hypothetical protein JJU28_18295 [Cyclobacteriaceae bacterium]|nr:hypothetical protein [Cyclobacteriaceae bacterium]
MRLVKFFMPAALSALFAIQMAAAQDTGPKPFVLRGYIKEMPALQVDKSFSNPNFLNILHNRLNFRWNASSSIHFVAESRNRMFYNRLFSEFPVYHDILGIDEGLVDMSWVWLGRGSHIGHTMIDRLYFDWRKDKWQVRIGRQRINWGVNLVSNPNDLFNTYSFFDFDYPERPGADAIRVQYYFSGMSQLQVAISPARDSRHTVAAAMLNFNRWNYDFQVLTGYFRNRMAAGAGWAGHIGGAGFKGEASWFYDWVESPGTDRGNLVAAAGLDYMLSGGTFLVLESLYNGGYQRLPGEDVFLLTQPLRPDNIMFSAFATTFSVQHPFSNVFSANIAIMAFPDIEAAFFMPGLNYSVATNLDFDFVSQIFSGGKGSMFEDAGMSWFVSLKYSF